MMLACTLVAACGGGGGGGGGGNGGTGGGTPQPPSVVPASISVTFPEFRQSLSGFPAQESTFEFYAPLAADFLSAGAATGADSNFFNTTISVADTKGNGYRTVTVRIQLKEDIDYETPKDENRDNTCTRARRRHQTSASRSRTCRMARSPRR
jgi:hypothetical protein